MFQMRLLLVPSLISAVVAQNYTNIVTNVLESTVAIPIYYLVAVGGALFVWLLVIGYCCCRRRAPPVAAPVAMQPQIVIGRKPRRAT